MKISNKYILTEATKLNQQSLRKVFNFLSPNIMNKLISDLWHYIDPRYVDTGAMVFSKEKSFENEIIKRLNIESYREFFEDDMDMKKIIKTIKSLNIGKNWVYDKKQKAFIKD